MSYLDVVAYRLLAATSDDAAEKSEKGTAAEWEAFGWGLLSASSLVLGAGVGIIRLPSKVVRAGMMAFGGGALIEALSIELFAHMLANARGGHGHGEEGEIDRPMIFLALASALAGGFIFAALDRMLSNHGAFLRKAATVRSKVGQLRYALTGRVINRLQQVPMFEVIPVQLLHRLVRAMVKERYAAKAVVFRELTSDSSIFFILSGLVELKINHKDSSGKLDNVEDRFLLGPNDIFGEMSLFTSETMQAKAVAVKPTTVLRIPAMAIHKLLASNKRLQDFVAMIAIDRLRETETFCRCTPSTVARLVSFMKQAEYEAGDVLFYDIDSLCPIYFVVVGRVEVTYTPNGVGTGIADRRRIVRANELLGTEHLMLGGAVHAKAVATERTTVLIVQRADIDKLCAHDERFHQALITSAKAGARLIGSDGKVFRPSAREEEENALALQRLVPPEGMAAPAKFGVDDFAGDLGWKRQGGAGLQTIVKVSDQESEKVDAQPLAASQIHVDALRGGAGESGDANEVVPHERTGYLVAGEPKANQPEDVAPVDNNGEVDRQALFKTPAQVKPAGAALDDSHPPDEPDLPRLQGSEEPEEELEAEDDGDAFQHDLLATQDLDALIESAEAAKRNHAPSEDHGHGHGHGRGVQAAIMIWLGILIDSVPESVVMGIMVNTSSKSALITFVCGVFLANFPEAMSSAGTMYEHKMRAWVIMLMWSATTVCTGIGAFIGAAAFPPGSKEDPVIAKGIACIEGLCGGAMLCMIANTVLPEAFEYGGNVTGMLTLMGFLTAIAVSVIL
eukprot:TRINITY_DN75413_c0_g1_i1.p1 TRINITY_DN75413_c0_g1~~TRINITY_DN75413_c0_g1_i1.p1  ORF type:complete len:792 (-),score=200.84 TRINITY_DN75413_c0_g1_i1:139-2514(-)